MRWSLKRMVMSSGSTDWYKDECFHFGKSGWIEQCFQTVFWTMAHILHLKNPPAYHVTKMSGKVYTLKWNENLVSIPLLIILLLCHCHGAWLFSFIDEFSIMVAAVRIFSLVLVVFLNNVACFSVCSGSGTIQSMF